MNIIMITGASSGMGLEFALQLDNVFDSIDEIWLIARRKEEMLKVAECMEHTTRILDMDVTNEAHMKRLAGGKACDPYAGQLCRLWCYGKLY